MKKTAVLILLVSFLINPATVLAAKKTMTKYIYDSDISVMATNTEPNPTQAGYYAIYAPGGNVTLASTTKLTGNIYVKTITANNDVEITGNVIFGGAEVEFQSVKVNGNICANGNLKMKQSAISGDINAQGNVTMNSGTTVGGSVYANGYVYLAENPVTVTSAVHAGGSVKIVDNCSANTVCYCNLCSTCSSCTITLSGSGKIKTPPATKGSCTAPLTCASVSSPNPTTYQPKYTATYEKAEPNSDDPIKIIKPGAHYVNMAYSNTTLIMEAGTCNTYGESGCYYLTSPNKVSIPAFYAGQNGNQTLKLDFSKGESIVVFADGAITWAGQIMARKDGTTWRPMTEYFEAVGKTDAVSLERISFWQSIAKKTYWETNKSFTINTPSLPRHWLGTVLTACQETTCTGDMTIPDTTSILGAFATISGSIKQDNHMTMYYVLADYARAHW